MLNSFGEFQRILVLGGKSDLAISILEKLPLAGDAELLLCGRGLSDFHLPSALAAFRVIPLELDFTDFERSSEIVSSVFQNGDVDLVIVAYSMLGDEVRQLDPNLLRQVLITNFVSQASVLNLVQARMVLQMHGQILHISSVAGLRPRRRNFVYGVSKFGVDFIAQGLQKNLVGKNVFITILRPGFVHTKMTKNMPPAPFATERTEVAKIASKALLKRKRIVYAPRILKLVMLVLRLLPERIFRFLDR